MANGRQRLRASPSPMAIRGANTTPKSGPMHYRARTYDPSTGRFLQTDPLGHGAGDLNLYRYVGNNPINATDPSGSS